MTELREEEKREKKYEDEEKEGALEGFLVKGGIRLQQLREERFRSRSREEF